MVKEVSGIFKPHLIKKPKAYKGGKSRMEVNFNGPLYKLSSNENPFGASPKAIAAIKKHIDQLYEYPDRTDRRLQNALSKYYDELLSPRQFMTANSGVGLLQMIAMCFLDKDTESICSSPNFKPYNLFTRQAGAKIVNVPLLKPDFELDVEGILRAVNKNTRVIWLCNPNNPTGTYIPCKVVEYLLSRLPNHVVVVYDEVYHQFVEEEDYTRAISFVNDGYPVISINSFSKAYGLAGLRVGYGYSTPEIAEYVSGTRRPFLLNTLAIEGAIAALEDIEFINSTVEKVQAGKRFLYDVLEDLNIPYWKSQANFILIKPKGGSEAFEQKMLKMGIMVRPVSSFEATGCVRVTVGSREANEAFAEALNRIIGT